MVVTGHECEEIGHEVPAVNSTINFMVAFEGYQFSAPSAFDRALRRLYGGYFALPPEAERKSRHLISAFSLPISPLTSSQNGEVDPLFRTVG